MDIIYTLIITFSMTSGVVTGDTLITLRGFESLEHCQYIMEEIVEGIPSDPLLTDIVAECVVETRA